MPSTIAFLTFASLTMAQSTILDFPVVGSFETAMTYAGSLVSADATATTVALACPPEEECGLFPYHTITWGPSLYHVDMSVPEGPDAFTMTQDCSLDNAKSTAVCMESAGGSEANFPGSSTTTYRLTAGATDRVLVTGSAVKMLDSLAEAKETTTETQLPTVSGVGQNPTGLSTMLSTNATGSPTQTGDVPESTGAAPKNVVALGCSIATAASVLLAALIL
ncbi:hypothetical protein M011DRAFT_470985 [Sporormia fimetaria CBS 119925]|uniref:GPI anchored protein n=1 Tax=Sporormia fimetaria CBS 119925 TaxID=1340428 RepID=A0A6A6V206_9PLEO|nr:hypothetical protein M011DRAFT_470985 [Sporormia fimetaria CBS 119925]